MRDGLSTEVPLLELAMPRRLPARPKRNLGPIIRSRNWEDILIRLKLGNRFKVKGFALAVPGKLSDDRIGKRALQHKLCFGGAPSQGRSLKHPMALNAITALEVVPQAKGPTTCGQA